MDTDIYTIQSPSQSVLVSAAATQVVEEEDNLKLGNPLTQGRGFFADQFEVCITSRYHPFLDLELYFQSKSNYNAHYNGTGPEIWSQTNGRIDAFVAGAGNFLFSYNPCFIASDHTHKGPAGQLLAQEISSNP